MADPVQRFQSLLLALAMASALAGCASHSAKKPSVQLAPGVAELPHLAPSATATVKTGIAIERWWAVFNDARLSSLIEEALAHNEDLESAVARVREAQANLDLARAAQRPSLGATLESSRAQQSIAGASSLPPGVDRRASSHSAALSASYEVDLWGRLASGTTVARQQLLASEWARATIEMSLTAQVAESYFGLAALDRQIEISEAVRAGRKATVLLRQREHEVGAGNEFDLRRAEAELNDTAATIASLSRSRTSLERSITALLGRTPREIAAGQ
jgi:outer membrane protein TolC